MGHHEGPRVRFVSRLLRVTVGTTRDAAPELPLGERPGTESFIELIGCEVSDLLEPRQGPTDGTLLARGRVDSTGVPRTTYFLKCDGCGATLRSHTRILPQRLQQLC